LKTSVSVIIPAYNEENIIGRAIDSVLKQEAQADEIIVVDDGSVDNTSSVASNYGSLVKVVKQKNKGLAAARNTGIMSSSSEYIAFLDADDEWLPNHLYNFHELLLKNKYLKWYCSSYQRKDESRILYNSSVHTRDLKNGVIDNYYRVEAKYNFSLPTVMIISRELLIKTELFNEDIRQFGEDLDLWFRIALTEPKLGYSNDISATYWKREESITSTAEIDIKRFINRVQRTESYALKSGSKLRIKSEPLIIDWINKVIRVSIKQNNKHVLRYINNYYGNRLSLLWKSLLILGIMAPYKIVKIVIRLKDKKQQQ